MFSRRILKRTNFTNGYLILKISRSSSTSKVKAYTEIPKVKGLPIIGSLKDYIQLEGGISQLHKLHDQRIQQYGSIYREKVGFKENLFTSNPEDIEKVFRNEQAGQITKRILPLWSLPAFNKKHGLPDSIAEMDHKNFARRKESIKKAILQPKQVAKLTEMYDIASKDFLSYMEMMKNPDTNIVDDIIKGLYLWAFECGGITVFRKHLDVLKEKEISDPSVKTLLEVHKSMFQEFAGLELGSFYHRLQLSKLWKSFEKNNMLIYQAVRKIVEKHDEHIIDKDADVTHEEKVSTCIDVLNGAVITTAEIALWAFIELSRNPEAQDKLYNEINKVVGNSEIIDNKLVQQMPYLRACLKECFRLRPLILTNGRTTVTDLVLSGYHVPKNTNVNFLVGYTGKTHPVEDNHMFKPERWMKDCPEISKPHPFAVNQFGHGIRACMGRRLAENELYTLFANVFKKYKINVENESFDTEFKLIYCVKDPISIRFESR